MRISRWGNSLAVRLPAALVEELNLKEGDDIDLSPRDEVTLEVSKALGPEEMIARLRAYRGWLPADFRFDRDEANER